MATAWVQGRLLLLAAAAMTAGWTTPAAAAAAAEAEATQPICCGPDDWQVRRVSGYLNVLNGQLEFGEIVSDVAHDADNEREVYFAQLSVARRPPQQHAFYLLYRDQLMYVYSHDTGECIKQTLTMPFRKRCIPASVTILDADVDYGSEAATINGGLFRVSLPRKDGNTLVATVSVSQDCIPIGQRFSILSPEGLKTEGAEFNNFKPGRVPDSLFELPQECDDAEFGFPQFYPSLEIDP